jgi:serine/threonine protein kinase
LNKKGKLSEEEARFLFKQLIHAVSYCHSKGLIHRDLKLENILFSNDECNEIRVIDFGLCGISNVDRSQSGTLAYMPPEVLSGYNTDALPSVDIWSMGCILCELITGRNPFAFGSKYDIRVMIRLYRIELLRQSLIL